MCGALGATGHDHGTPKAFLLGLMGESPETVMTAKDGDADKIIYEVTDLWFHTMVLLAQQGLTSAMVTTELARRIGLSGLAEKAARSASATTKP